MPLGEGGMLGSAEEGVLSSGGGQVLGYSLESEHITPGCMCSVGKSSIIDR